MARSRDVLLLVEVDPDVEVGVAACLAAIRASATGAQAEVARRDVDRALGAADRGDQLVGDRGAGAVEAERRSSRRRREVGRGEQRGGVGIGIVEADGVEGRRSRPRTARGGRARSRRRGPTGGRTRAGSATASSPAPSMKTVFSSYTGPPPFDQLALPVTRRGGARRARRRRAGPSTITNLWWRILLTQRTSMPRGLDAARLGATRGRRASSLRSSAAVSNRKRTLTPRVTASASAAAISASE